jgi:hypothetical protein
MLLFRSEDHLQAWLDGRERGATISITTLAELAAAWWGDRLDDDWRPHTRDQNQAILTRLGLSDPFWRLG